ncbi:helicase-related protein [Priestia megaterium]|uniref:DEAD/DEAH box helicase n=1 Tax=Priestia megaterium TaxID=1404 RepID=UPI00345ABA92
MSNQVNESYITNLVKKENIDLNDIFLISKWLNRAIQLEEKKVLVRDILLRLLDKRDSLPPQGIQIVEQLVERVGYFPYIDVENKELPLKTLLHYEFYRSENIPDVVMHQRQAEVFNIIEQDKSVILSAPTSFGKSLLIEEIVASVKYSNIVIVLPTIALIDETRLKLSKYSHTYKLIFTTKQKLKSKNIFILTPERLVEIEGLPNIDFFIIDEFYKLSDDSPSNGRANVLNHAFYKLLKYTSQFYLLGPNIASIPSGFIEKYDCNFIQTNYSTVTSDEYIIEREKGKELSQLIELLYTFKEPTLIYCKSPAKAEEYTKAFIDYLGDNYEQTSKTHLDAINWIKNNIHPQWSLIEAFKFKVAFHHGSMPRHLGRYIVNEFNRGNINVLFCTSTLIEGVNTTAKNVVIFDNKKGRNMNISYFDYKNIRGRAGRMKQHFIGRVYSFYTPPNESSLHVDFPWFTQEKASDEVLIQIDESDLKPVAKKQIENYVNQNDLEIEIIQKNSNISVAGQISLAKDISENLEKYHPYLSWSGIPSYNALKKCCELLWKHKIAKPEDYVHTASQLTFFVNKYRTLNTSIPALVKVIMERDDISPDKAVQKVSKIVKNWFEFKFPKYLLALENIQRQIYSKNGMSFGDYKFYAARIESAFCHPSLAALQEFGVPISLLKKLESSLNCLQYEDVDVDDVIKEIKTTDFSNTVLDAFEIKLLRELVNN